MSTIEDFQDLPLCTSPLSFEEATKLETAMIPLRRFLGSPGDWGYSSKLGKLTQLLHELHIEVAKAKATATDRGEP